MAPPTQPQDGSDSRNQDDETQEREPVQPRRRASANDPNHNNLLQAIRLADGPGSGHVLVDGERLSDNVRGRAGLGFQTETATHPSEARLIHVERLRQNNAAYQQIQGATQDVAYRQMHLGAQHQRSLLFQEQTGTPEATLQPRLAPALGQDAPLNPTQQLAQTGQPRSYMPSLRSQPEFYMTGVTAVNTTAEPLTDNPECTICLEPLSDDVVKFHACGHMFHTVCVQSWFDQSAPRTGHKRGTCPNCRHELYEPDPRYARTAPPQNVERPVVIETRRRFAPPLSDRDQLNRSEEATATTQPSRGHRRNEFVADFRRRLAEQEQNTAGEQAPAVTPQRQATARRSRAPRGRGEPTRGDQLPRTDALERARDYLPAQEDAVSLPPRTSSLPHGGAIRRQQASQIMTDALRVTASPRHSHSRREWIDPDTSSNVPIIDESPRTASVPLERPNAPTPTVDRHPVHARESRATLAARAIAQRRPLVLEPGLNNTDADLPHLIRRPALDSEHTTANRSRDSLPAPGSQGHGLVIVPQPDLPPAERAIRDLQHEQNVLLDRLREVQNQIGRYLQAAGTSRERRATVVLPSAPNHLPHETQDDLSTRRPPPIAIPHLADPATSDLRSAREFPDLRAIGSGTSIWSADYVTPSRRNTQRQASQIQQFSALLSHLSNGPTADTPTGVTNRNDQIPTSPGSMHEATSLDEQPASADNPSSSSESRQMIQEVHRQHAELRRLVSEHLNVEQLLGPAPTDDDAPEALQ